MSNKAKNTRGDKPDAKNSRKTPNLRKTSEESSSPLEPERGINPYEGWFGFGKDRVQTGRTAALVVFAIVLVTGLGTTFLGDKSPLASFFGEDKSESAAQSAAFKESPGKTETSSTATALDVLNKLEVHDKDPFNDFNRNRLFGEGWLDLDGDDCNTRNEILARDLDDVEFRNVKPRNCVVQSGILHDVYTGKTIEFLREQGRSDDVQIDHVVALGNVWRTGGQDLDQKTREEIANDPLNLIAVDGETNQDKESKDASEWLPPNQDFRCEYVARQVAVKAKYELWVTAAEKNAMAEVLERCPDEKMPVE